MTRRERHELARAWLDQLWAAIEAADDELGPDVERWSADEKNIIWMATDRAGRCKALDGIREACARMGKSVAAAWGPEVS